MRIKDEGEYSRNSRREKVELWRDFVDFVALIVSWWIFVNLEIRIDLIKRFFAKRKVMVTLA